MTFVMFAVAVGILLAASLIAGAWTIALLVAAIRYDRRRPPKPPANTDVWGVDIDWTQDP